MPQPSTTSEQTPLTEALRRVLLYKIHWLLIVVAGSFLIVGIVEYCKAPWYYALSEVYVEGRDAVLVSELLSSRDLRNQKLRKDPAWLATYESGDEEIDADQIPFRLLFLSPKTVHGLYTVTFIDSIHFSIKGPDSTGTANGMLDHPFALGQQMMALEGSRVGESPSVAKSYDVHILNEWELNKKIKNRYYVSQMINAPSKISVSVRSPDSAFGVHFLQGIVSELLAEETEEAAKGIDSAISALQREMDMVNISIGKSPGFLDADKASTLSLFQQLHALDKNLERLRDVAGWVDATVDDPVPMLPNWTDERLGSFEAYDSSGASMLRRYLLQDQLAEPVLLRGDLVGGLRASQLKMNDLLTEREGELSMLQMTYMNHVNSVIYRQEKQLESEYDRVGVSDFAVLMQLQRELILLKEKRQNVNCGIRVIVLPHASYEGRIAYPTKYFFWVPFTLFWVMLVVLTRIELGKILGKKETE